MTARCELCSSIHPKVPEVKFLSHVTYDMGWQKRSSWRRYDSSSGHAFIIGASIKGIIRMVLYSKA